MEIKTAKLDGERYLVVLSKSKIVWSLHHSLEIRDVPHEYTSNGIVVEWSDAEELRDRAHFEAEYADDLHHRTRETARRIYRRIDDLLAADADMFGEAEGVPEGGEDLVKYLAN